jgi:hypothetical protein
MSFKITFAASKRALDDMDLHKVAAVSRLSQVLLRGLKFNLKVQMFER